jgi:bifunctional oligoribonuclease and PAP phosphatase NrnA
MSAYASTATLAQIADRIAAARRIVLLTHHKPDGDAAGSTLALARALHVLGKQADIYWTGPVEPNLKVIAPPTTIHCVQRMPTEADGDLVIVVDTGSWSQLEPMTDWLRPRMAMIVGLDHHARGDDVAPMRYVDVAAASTTQIVASLLEVCGLPLRAETPGMAGSNGSGGWFRFNNADAATHALAATLIACGVQHVRLLQILEENHRPARLGLEAKALASLEYACNGAATIMSLSQDDFRQSGGTVEDLTGLVNIPLVVQQVRLSVLLTQSEPGKTKLSFRSKPRTDVEPDAAIFDVNQLAGRFGGGGHVHAAGARTTTDLATARRSVLAMLETGV